MEAILRLQGDIKEKIERAKSNFKKAPRDRINVAYVEARVDNLEQYWAEFLKNDIKIVAGVDERKRAELRYVSDDVFNDTEEAYLELKSLLKTVLADLKATQPNLQPQVHVSNCTGSHTKLREIPIPKFSGNYLEWTTFRDLFVSLVHKNARLDDVQKFQHLKAHLVGEAEQLLRHIPISEHNYAQGWQILERRYSNKRYLSNSILKRLLSQRNATGESAGALKELLDTTSDCLLSLKGIGINVESWDILLIHIVSYKLDAETRKQWEIKVCENDTEELPTFVEFKKFLESRFRALENIDFKAARTSNVSNNETYKPRVFHVANEICKFCKDAGHKLAFCKGFLKETVENKRAFVQGNGVCYNCLGSNHPVRNCQSSISCQVCSRRHHSLLHATGVPGTYSADTLGRWDVMPVANGGGDGSYVTVPQGDSTNVVACFSTGGGNREALLPTAQVGAESKTGDYQVVRALLDQGAQASFITEATAQFLGLKKTQIRGHISGIGNQQSMTSKSVVKFKIKSLANPTFIMEVQAYVLRSITSLLPTKKVEIEGWEELKTLTLADPEYKTPHKINMLLGAEVYGQIIQEGVKRGPSGTPVAQRTTLGWILSGTVEQPISRFQVVTHATLQPEEQKLGRKINNSTRYKREDGRYRVEIPFRDEYIKHKEDAARGIAARRLSDREMKVSRNLDVKAHGSGGWGWCRCRWCNKGGENGPGNIKTKFTTAPDRYWKRKRET